MFGSMGPGRPGRVVACLMAYVVLCAVLALALIPFVCLDHTYPGCPLNIDLVAREWLGRHRDRGQSWLTQRACQFTEVGISQRQLSIRPSGSARARQGRARGTTAPL